MTDVDEHYVSLTICAVAAAHERCSHHCGASLDATGADPSGLLASRGHQGPLGVLDALSPSPLAILRPEGDGDG